MALKLRLTAGTICMRLIIVKKGAFSTFRFFERSCRDIPGIHVIWDRRKTRAGRSARDINNALPGDRRGEPPHSWTAADHVLAGASNPPVLVVAGDHDLTNELDDTV